MKAKWKKNKNLNPDVILTKLDDIKIVGEQKKVSFPAFEAHFAFTALINMVEFPTSASGLEHSSIVKKAVSVIAKEHELNKSRVIQEINLIIKELLTTRERRFHILTSISLKPPYPARSVNIDGCSIRLLNSNYPKKYTGRNTVISKFIKNIDGTPRGYAKVILTLKARSEKEAFNSAIRTLDLQRAIWSLYSNSQMELIGDEWKPINKIRLGGAHTIHKDNGRIASEIFWYETNFVLADTFSHTKSKTVGNNTKWAFQQIIKSRYGVIIKDALLRYVRALDEKDPNTALIRLWSALEVLSATSGTNFDSVTRRIAFLFTDNEYHRQVLEHLRDHRNRNIHAGEEGLNAKTNCFQLQFYFYELFHFHIRNSDEFTSFNEACAYLDLPASKEDLVRKKQMIEKAIKFRD